MENCLLSIVVPVYNVEKYVKDCLDSICESCDERSEIIIIDDGSTDSSSLICETYAERYKNVSLIHQQNRGLGAARNTGTKISKGKYIIWIDSDDIVSESWYSSIMNIIESERPDLIFYDYREFGNANKEYQYGSVSGFVSKDQFMNDTVADSKLKAFSWQKVIKREFALKELFKEERLPMEDYDICYRLYIQANSFYYIKDMLYLYRIRNDSLSRNHDFAMTKRSYNLSVSRYNTVERKYRNSSVTARCIQGFHLGRRYEQNLPEEDKTYICQVMRYIRRNIPLTLFSKYPSLRWKLKFIYISFFWKTKFFKNNNIHY